MKNKKQTRNLKGQFAKEEPYSRIASLCGLILIVAGVGVTLLNLCRVDKKIETTIRLDREMIEYTRQIVVSQEQQKQAEKALSEQVEEVKKEVKEEVKEVKAEVNEVKKEVKIKYAYMNGNWSEEQLKVRIETEKRIREIAGDYKHTDYMIKICDCESMLGLKMKNDKGNYPKGSVDEGYFQWNSYWQKEINNKCKYNLECEVKEVIKKIDAGGQGIWVCDKYVRGTDNFR